MTGKACTYQENKASVLAGNTVIRTDPRWDGMVRHLGYEPVDVTPDILDRRIPTDRELIQSSQERLSKVAIIPDSHLPRLSLAHIVLARKITLKVVPDLPPAGVHAARIPPASDRTRTAGVYSTTNAIIYIDVAQLARCCLVIDTLVHELAHHRQFRDCGEAEDLTPAHFEMMRQIAAEVIAIVARGELDSDFKEVVW